MMPDAGRPTSPEGAEPTRPPSTLKERLAAWSRSPWVRRVETALLIGLLAFVLYRLAPQLSALTGVGGEVGSAPPFTVTTLDGDTLTSKGLRGRVVVVNFWATWCPPCRLEMPSLQALAERRGDDGVVVLGLSTDVGPAAPIREFLDERGITYPVARADRATRAAFGGITGIPTTVLLDRDGRIRHRVVGYFVPPAMDAAVGRLLQTPASE